MVAVFEGGIEVAEALQDLPADHVFFTGSPAVGKRVMAAAARHLSSVTLELGGKNPAIVGQDANLADAAAKVAGARFSNAGQLCLSVDHAWVHRSQIDTFTQVAAQVVQKMFYAEGQLQKERFPRIVDARNLARLRGYLDDALTRGARLVCGGNVDEHDLSFHP
ncbi:MAG: aldehyde dehydrogenase, partial [Pseudomonas sp. PGPPP3]